MSTGDFISAGQQRLVTITILLNGIPPPHSALVCQGVIHAVSALTHTTDGRQHLATRSEEVKHAHTFKSLES